MQLHTLASFGLAGRGVSVVKMDVEDMEPEVIRGGREFFAYEQPVIYAEARDEAAHNRLAVELEPTGYEFVEQIPVATPVERWDPR